MFSIHLRYVFMQASCVAVRILCWELNISFNGEMAGHNFERSFLWYHYIYIKAVLFCVKRDHGDRPWRAVSNHSFVKRQLVCYGFLKKGVHVLFDSEKLWLGMIKLGSMWTELVLDFILPFYDWYYCTDEWPESEFRLDNETKLVQTPWSFCTLSEYISITWSLTVQACPV